MVNQPVALAKSVNFGGLQKMNKIGKSQWGQTNDNEEDFMADLPSAHPSSTGTELGSSTEVTGVKSLPSTVTPTSPAKSILKNLNEDFYGDTDDPQVSSSEVRQAHQQDQITIHQDGNASFVSDGRWFGNQKIEDLKIDNSHFRAPSPNELPPDFGSKEMATAFQHIEGVNETKDLNLESNLVNHLQSIEIKSRVAIRELNIVWKFFDGNDLEHSEIVHDVESIQQINRRADNEGHNSDDVELKGVHAAGEVASESAKLLEAMLVDDYNQGRGMDLPSKANANQPKRGQETEGGQSEEGKRTQDGYRGRDVNQMLELRLVRVKARVDNVHNAGVTSNEETQLATSSQKPPPKTALTQNIVMGIHDVKVVDRLRNSPYDNLLFHWSSKAEHRDDDCDMMNMHFMEISSQHDGDGKEGKETKEYRFRCKFLPLRVNLAQAALKHFHQMLSFERQSHGRNFRTSAKCQKRPAGVFFQTFELQQIPLKMDYQPQNTDFQAIRDGNMTEVLNLLPIEGMEITLKNIKLHAVEGFDAALGQCASSWVDNIYHKQLYQYLAGVNIPPLRSLSRLGQGAANLVLLPLRNYQDGRRIDHGIRNNVEDLAHTAAVETMNTVSSFAVGTKTLLEHLDDIVAPRNTAMAENVLAPRTTFNARGNIQKARISSHANQPGDVNEGLTQAYEAMHKNLAIAKHVIVAVPVIEYKRGGWKGAIKSVIRAVPVAVLRPVIGATEAVSRTAMGVRNTLDPESKRDMDVKYKIGDKR